MSETHKNCKALLAKLSEAQCHEQRAFLSMSLYKNRCFIIGEIAQAHDGSLGMAHAYIDAIANTGADAVKFQTHIAAAESTPGETWRVKFSEQDATRYDYWRRMEFTEPQWHGLKKHAEEKGLQFLSSPFSAPEFLRAVCQNWLDQPYVVPSSPTKCSKRLRWTEHCVGSRHGACMAIGQELRCSVLWIQFRHLQTGKTGQTVVESVSAKGSKHGWGYAETRN
jgi:NeuB family